MIEKPQAPEREVIKPTREPSRIRKGAATLALFLLYLQARLMYLPVFWMGFPNFEHWATMRDEGKYFFINRDLPVMAVVYLHIAVICALSAITGMHWAASIGIIAALSAIIYLYNWIIALRRIKKTKAMRDADEKVTQILKP